MKVAIVHDYLKEYGGAERVVEAILEIWPEADLYTTVFLPEYAGFHRKKVESWRVKTTFLQHFPFKAKLLSPIRLIAPWVFKNIDLSDYDVVITSTAGTYTSPNFVKVGPETLHICYCHTPPRYLYGYPVANAWDEVFWRKILKFLGQIPMHLLRMYDFKASQLPDYFVANSAEVAGRIKKFYRRDSTVIYPPVEVEIQDSPLRSKSFEGQARSKIQDKKTYYLAGGRLSRHKRLDLAIKACTKLNVHLKVFGGTFASYGIDQLKEYAGKNVEFLGEISDEEKQKLMFGAKAFLFPSDREDFGILPVEAMAAGTPVIAYRSGGVKETVVEGKTGLFFDELTADSLIEVIKKFEKMKFDPAVCRKQAAKFSKERFQQEMKLFISNHQKEK